MNVNTISSSLFSDWIGSDTISKIYQNQFSNSTQTYPPYNVIRTGDNKYSIEIAVAGFSKDEINVEVENDRLTIAGEKLTGRDPESFIHRGISSKNFSRVFGLMENVQIRDVTLVNGILSIALEHVVPEAQKKRKLTIETDFPKLADSGQTDKN